MREKRRESYLLDCKISHLVDSSRLFKYVTSLTLVV
jgi:hypothetical protein